MTREIRELSFKRILFATDFLESSRLALDYAVAMAHHFQATLVLLHVVTLSPPAQGAELVTSKPSVTRQDAETRLKAFAAGVIRTGVSVEILLAEGIPWEAILEATRTRNADLLVLGVHGIHRGLEHLLIGSNTEKILLSASCPTLTVGAHVRGGIDLDPAWNRILYLADSSPSADASGAYAFLLGNEFKVPVDVCYLSTGLPEDADKLRAGWQDRHHAMLAATLPTKELSAQTDVCELDPSRALEQLLSKTEELASGLLVLDVHPESQFARHFHGSLVYSLVAKAACPILSISQSLPVASAVKRADLS